MNGTLTLLVQQGFEKGSHGAFDFRTWRGQSAIGSAGW
jgi:hypothetical protein